MNVTKFRVVIACLFFVLTAILTQSASGQNDGYLTDSNTRGFAPGNSFQSAAIDNINLGNGALNLHIPLIERKGRGLDSSAFITYSSKIWSVTPIWNSITNTLTGVNWGYSPTLLTVSPLTIWPGFGVVGAGGNLSVAVRSPIIRAGQTALSAMFNIAIQ